MSAQLDQIRFQMEEARREHDIGRQGYEMRIRQEGMRFWIQIVVTSLTGVAVATTLVLRLLGKL
jgi:hypothetical protein